jgi:acetate kinase
MPDALLVLNAGSSSLKFSVFLDHDPPRPLLRGQIEGLLTAPRFVARDGTTTIAEKAWPTGTRLMHRGAIEFLFEWGRSGGLGEHRIVAVGHRVVHGGTRFSGPSLVEPGMIAELEALIPLAPLHQPHNLTAIAAVTRMAPALPQVACFDTAFHRTQPSVAQTFGLPRRLTDEGIRRYGFHGLSYEHVAAVLADTDERAAAGRTVVAHLGNLDGLLMGTRCGEIDPGVLLYLLDRHRMSARALQELLYEQSGLLGVSGHSSDMRVLLRSSDSADIEAVDLFIYRISHALGSLAAALGGLDALVFTGGIGENAAFVRARVCRDAAWLGVQLDEMANARGGPRISRMSSGTSAWVIPADEEAMIAQHTRRVVGSMASASARGSGTYEHR